MPGIVFIYMYMLWFWFRSLSFVVCSSGIVMLTLYEGVDISPSSSSGGFLISWITETLQSVLTIE